MGCVAPVYRRRDAAHTVLRHSGVSQLRGPAAPDRQAARSRRDPEAPRAPGDDPLRAEPRPRPTRGSAPPRPDLILEGAAAGRPRCAGHSMPLSRAGSPDPRGAASVRCGIAPRRLWHRFLGRPASASGGYVKLRPTRRRRPRLRRPAPAAPDTLCVGLYEAAGRVKPFVVSVSKLGPRVHDQWAVAAGLARFRQPCIRARQGRGVLAGA